MRQTIKGVVIGVLVATAVTLGAQSPQAPQFPALVLPASAVNGGGTFSPQLFGPVGNCTTAPAYSFTGDTNTGFSSDTADAWCLAAGGVAQLRGSSTAVTSTVPLQVTSVSDSYFTGNVGVGVTSPLKQLDILGANKTIASDDYHGLIRSNNAQAIDLGGSLAFGGYNNNAASAVVAFASISGRKSNGSDGNSDGYLAFATRGGGAAQAERWRMTADGHFTAAAAYNITTTGALSAANLTGSGNLVVSGVGPHAIGAASANYAQTRLGGSFAGGSEAYGLYFDSTIIPLAGNGAGGFQLNPTFVEAASGTHARFATLDLQQATVTAGVGTLTDTATLYIEGAMSATVTGANYALWVDAGNVRFDGSIFTSADRGFGEVTSRLVFDRGGSYYAGFDFFTASSIGFSVNSAAAVSVSAGGSYGLAAPFVIRTAPSGPVACTSPTVTWSNGTAAFQIDVGTTCAGVSTLSFTLPAATNGWECAASNQTTAARDVWATAWTTTSVTLTNTARTTGLATDWADGADVRVKCTAG